MKRKIGYLVVITLLLMTTGCKSAKLENGQDLVAKLDNINITAEDLYQQYKNTVGVETLVDMINEKLLNTKYETTDEMTSQVKSQITYLKSYLGDDFGSAILYYYKASSEEELTNNLLVQLKTKKLTEEYIEANLTEKEIKKYYDDTFVAAKHILISADSSADEAVLTAASNKAKDVIKKLNNGGDWDKLAKEYSNDTSNASKGGDLGTFGKGSMVDEFYSGVTALKIGKYSTTPVKTSYGYHIILRTKPDAYEDIKDDVKESLVSAKIASNPELQVKALINLHKESNLTWEDTDLKKLYNDYMDYQYENSKVKEEQ